MENDLIGQVKKIVDLISYQAGAVVSRTLIDKPAGTVTLFAFDQGEGLSEHTAPYDALVEVLEGELEVKIAGEPHQLKAADLIIMPAGQPHALRAATSVKMILTMIKS